ncbi:hypothetical protein SHJG_3761 [Streptomyces hygroscopicus subsp. jinggangensis 5008]|nr:hypothetical protein SHJG_3761 [Streptomyces hygroscopicus subsp. jinggangensis 5008]AGF63191.1 hypothetical protein SHJGH_3526 [Streptomyces hygroscopicus subsp. jinggangensis TL01]
MCAVARTRGASSAESGRKRDGGGSGRFPTSSTRPSGPSGSLRALPMPHPAIA